MLSEQEAARILWTFHSQGDKIAPADLIIGLGSYDLRVAARCAELFHANFAPEVLFSGAAGNWTEGLFAGSEAEAFGAHAQTLGVPTDALVLEREASNIGENIRFSAALRPGVQRVILVTKPQTQLRCRATVARQWPEVEALVTAPRTTLQEQPLPHHSRRALYCEMVGDLDRLQRYPALGFQIPIDIPHDVLAAADVLRTAGYLDHLPNSQADCEGSAGAR